jgi:hypothetical protein
MRALAATAIMITAALAWSACASDGSSGSSGAHGSVCPSDLPKACPDPAPSYAAEVAPLISGRCLKCHDSTGVAGANPLDSYARVYAARSTVLTRVYGCQMPPAPEPPLTSDERKILLGWLVCGAPDN